MPKRCTPLGQIASCRKCKKGAAYWDMVSFRQQLVLWVCSSAYLVLTQPTSSRTDQRDQPGLNCFTTRYCVVTTRHVYFYTPGNPEDHGKLPMGFAFLSQNLFSSCPDLVLFLNITTELCTVRTYVVIRPPHQDAGRALSVGTVISLRPFSQNKTVGSCPWGSGFKCPSSVTVPETPANPWL